MFIFYGLGTEKIQGENIENDWEVINRGVAFIEEEEVVNNGSEIVEMEEIFDLGKYNLGGVMGVVRAHEGGYIVVTAKDINPPSKEEYWVLKNKNKMLISEITEEGDLLWVRIYGYKGMKRNFCEEIKGTSDGGYIIVGECSEGMFSDDLTELLVVKLDEEGNVEWDKVWGPNKGERSGIHGVGIMEVEGGYIVVSTNTCGGRFSKDKRHYYVMGLNNEGKIGWRKDLLEEDEYRYFRMKSTYLNNQREANVILGQKRNNFLYIKIDKNNGKIKKETNYNLEFNNRQFYFYKVYLVEMNDMKRLIVGVITDEEVRKDGIFVMKEDEDKGAEWFKIFWNGNNRFKYNGIVRVGDEYVIYGKLYYDWWDVAPSMFMIKIDKEGNIIGRNIFDKGNYSNEIDWMGVDSKGRLVGMFYWAGEENGEYKAYEKLERVIFR